MRPARGPNSETAPLRDTLASIAVTLAPASTLPVSVAYATSDGSAAAGSDYQASSGTLTFQPGTTSQTISVPVHGDTFYEDDETFSVALSAPTGATIGTGQGNVTITNDDAAPSVSVDDVVTPEGDAGAHAATFTVTLSQPSAVQATVGFSVGGGSALAGSDYTATSGTLTFALNTTQTIAVSIVGDPLLESDETFDVVLTNPTRAVLAKAVGIGTILNDDAAPVVSVGATTITEGDSGTSTATFTVALSGPSGIPVTVTYGTADGTATAGSDYVGVMGTLTFSPGTVAQTVAVAVVGDTAPEADETFTLVLSNPVNATLGDAIATGTIRNDDPSTLAVSSVTNPEGNQGTTAAVFTVTLSPASDQVVRVAYATANRTAVANGDYLPASGTLEFAPGMTMQTIAVDVLGDVESEGDETFDVVLSQAEHATIATPVGTGTIANDDASALSVANVSIVEGGAEGVSASFVVTLSPASLDTVTVDYATADGTALADSDYTPRTGTLTFAPGVTTQTIAAPILGDTQFEADETFTLTLTAPTNATVPSPQATATIVNDDPAPVLSIAGTTLIEGNAGTTNAVFAVTLTPASPIAATVAYATADGSATANTDYTPVAGTLTFAPGTTTQTVLVPVIGDTAFEGDETFSISLGSAAQATIGTSTATGTITNDDAPPTVNISSVVVPEGQSGTSTATFTVTLAPASAFPVSVSYATVEGTALAGADFTPASGTLTFPSGVTERSLTVSIVGDTIYENDETFTVVLNTPANAVIGAGQGTGTITNDDPLPTLSISGSSRLEGDAGAAPLVFTVALTPPSSLPVTVAYSTSDGTAKAGSDYTATSGTLTFPPASTTQTISVSVLGDTQFEGDETFAVALSAAVNASIATGTATGTIGNDDTMPSISMTGGSVVEGQAGLSTLAFSLTLSAPSEQPVTVGYATADETATTGSDYTATSGIVTFAPGVLSQTVSVPVVGDTTFEADETFVVTLTTPMNGLLATSQARGTIVNDDAPPALNISGASVVEGNVGTTSALFVVTLTPASGLPVTVPFATANGTATAGSDYIATSGTLTFAAGVTAQTITVPILGDTLFEGTESFTVALGSATNATVAVASAAGVIQNDDAAPVLNVSNVTVTEGNSGTSAMTFTVTLSQASTQPVTVAFATANGTATAGSDYTATSGTLTFAPNVTSQAIAVTIAGDSTPEGDETLTLTLSGPTNAVLGSASAVGTILDNDARVTVTAPNTSVNWSIGTSQAITWSHNLGTGSTMRVELSRNGGASWELLAASVANSSSTSGSYVWTVTAPATTTATVRVSWTGNARIADASDTSFTVAAPQVTVTSPNTSTAVWTVGTTATITFLNNLGSRENVKIELSRDGGLTYPTVLFSSTSATGSKNVSVKNTWTTTHGRVRVTWLKDGTVVDASDQDFTIR